MYRGVRSWAIWTYRRMGKPQLGTDEPEQSRQAIIGALRAEADGAISSMNATTVCAPQVECPRD